MNYLVADFIIRLKNASLAHRKEAVLPYSLINKAIGKVLVKEGYLEEIKEEGQDGRKSLKATIRYKKRMPVLTGVSIVSKPSLRVYVKSADVYAIERRGMHTAIFSTSTGVLTGKEAQKKGVGGELLFEVW